MAAITYREPTYVGSNNIKEPYPALFQPAQQATWRRGDILILSTTGSVILAPAGGTGAGVGISGPPASVTTFGTSTSSAAPAQTFYGYCTYWNTSADESMPGPLFVINVPAGKVPTVTVGTAGEPSGFSHFRTYLGLLPDFVCLQTASGAGTATGSAFTTAQPLTNYQGVKIAATAPSSNIIGIAQHAYNENYFDGYAGSFLAGNPGSRLGSTNTISPMTPTEAPLAYVITLDNGTQFEFSLNSASGAFSELLIGSSVGFTLDSTTGWWTADTTATAAGVIVGYRPGAYIGPTTQGQAGDTGVRVVCRFNASALAI